jgi:hypothetical protein
MAEGRFVIYLLLVMLLFVCYWILQLYILWLAEMKLLSFSTSCLLHGHLSWKHGLRAPYEGECVFILELGLL